MRSSWIAGACALALAAWGCSRSGTTGGEAKAASNAAQPQQQAQPRPGPSAAAVRGVEDPRAYVAQVFADPLNDAVRERGYSERLAGLLADEHRDAGGEIGRLDFDPWVNAQDIDINHLRITEQPVEGRDDRKIIVARFDNAGGTTTNHFYFERVNGRWFLDDIRNTGSPNQVDSGWTLSLILKYGD